MPSWYPNEDDYTGIGGTFVREHAKAVALGNDVMVLFPYFYVINFSDFIGSIKNLIPVKTSALEEGIEVTRVKIPVLRIAIRYLGFMTNTFLPLLCYLFVSMVLFMRIRRRFNPHIIHAHVSFPAGVAGALISKVFSIPLIISEHAGPFSQLMPTKIHKYLVGYSLKTAFKVLPVSKFLKMQIEMDFKIQKFEIIPNVVDNKIFYPAIGDQVKNDIINILFVGLFFPNKQIPILLEAISLLKKEGTRDFKLHIVGHERHLGAEYRAVARKLGIGDIVIFLGEKKKNEVADFMRHCSFLVLPSMEETFGCVVIEAMSCGKPVLATRCGGPEEIINNENGILVKPGDVKAMKDGLNFMINNYSRFDSDKIARNCSDLYSLNAVGERLAIIYKAAL